MIKIYKLFCFSWALNFITWLVYWWHRYQMYRARDQLVADNLPACAADLQAAQCPSPQVNFSYIGCTWALVLGTKRSYIICPDVFIYF